MKNDDGLMGKSAINKKKSKGWRKKISALLVIAAVSLAAWFFLTPKKGVNDVIQTFNVRKEIIQNQIQISGYIEPAQKQILLSPGEGIIKKVSFKEGDRVKKGDLIFALDSSYQAMQAAKQEFAIEKEKVNGASKTLELMEKELELLRRQLNDRNVYAKFDGIIADFDITEGAYAVPKDNFGTIIDSSFFKSVVEVSEVDVANLKVGQKVLLSFPSAPDVEVEGEVKSRASIAKVNPQRGSTVIEAKIVVPSLPEGILPGYSFSGKIITGDDMEFLLVEQAAIFYEEGIPFVERIVEGDKTEKVNIEVAPYIRGIVKIISGLNEGDILAAKVLKNPMAGF